MGTKIYIEFKSKETLQREEISKNVTRLQTTSEVISSLDVLTSFAQVAEDFNYCMPVVDSSGTIDIKNGRHPVIEKILGEGIFVEIQPLQPD